MLQVFNKSSIGYSHIKAEKPCQDFSATYRDPERVIITCCDGHGGDLYVRSKIGSQLASNAVINVFSKLTRSQVMHLDESEVTEKIKLDILCKYNELVENHYGNSHLRKSEIANLKEDDLDILRMNPAKAYGTTLTGAMVLGCRLVVVGIGDSEVLGIQRGKIVKLFDTDDDPAGNITYSMCQDDAFNHLRVRIIDFRTLDGVILCTDGLSSPYQSYDNFNNSFVKPMVLETLKTKSTNHVYEFVEQIAQKLGVGDDVSLSFILKDDISKLSYRGN